MPAGGVDHRVRVVLLGDVTCDGDGLTAGGADLLDELIELRLATRSHHHLGAGTRKQLRRRVSDPRTRTHHNCHPVD